MHELSIALSILEGVEEKMASYPRERVEAVIVRLGPLSGVHAGALASAYDMAATCTGLAGSRLVIEHTPILIYCSKCGVEQPAESLQRMICAVCGTPSGDVRGGSELEVLALQLADES